MEIHTAWWGDTHPKPWIRKLPNYPA